MPVGDVLVGDAGGNIKHDNAALSLDVIAITQTTELFLAGSVPDVEADGTKVGSKGQRVDLDTKSGCTRSRQIKKTTNIQKRIEWIYTS